MRFYDREKEIRRLHEIKDQSLDNAQFTVYLFAAFKKI